jgi:DNA-binding MurR/RpiR family transcriptional regulator
LNNGEDVLSLSVKELSLKTFTSPATIVRLCKKIGLEGYNDFKIKYSAELQYDNTNKKIDVNYPFLKDDSNEVIANNIASMSKEVISNTFALIDYETIDKIIDLIIQYDDIDIYGSGNSILAALSFQHKMMRIGKNVNVKTIPGEQIFMAYNANDKKLSIIISYSGETIEILRMAKVIREKNSPIIAITSIGDNQLSHIATHIIHIDSREKIFNKIAPYASQISMEYVFNFLFSCVFSKNYDKNIKHKLDNDKKNDSRHPLYSPINEDE